MTRKLQVAMHDKVVRLSSPVGNEAQRIRKSNQDYGYRGYLVRRFSACRGGNPHVLLVMRENGACTHETPFESLITARLLMRIALIKDRGNLMKDRPNFSRCCPHCFLVFDDYYLLNVVCCAK